MGTRLNDGATTRTLATWVAGLDETQLPDVVVQRVKDILLDTFASAIAGNGGEEIDQIDAVARAFGGPSDEATVIGRAPSSAVGASLINGYLITAATVCDVHRPTLCHVTPEVIPPAMAIAERQRTDGRSLITAIAAGLEVTTRVGLGLQYEAFRRHGWHSPGVTGPFGGSASAGRLLGLDADRQCNAFGLAGSQAAGTFAHWGTPTIKFHQARGAMAGLLAASLAETGFQASPDILGAPDGGIFNTYADGGSIEEVVADLGERWELMNISLRLWPVASSIQSMVTALFAILDREPLDPGEIASVRIGLSEPVYKMHGELGWDTRFRALLSTRYVASVILHDKACWLPQFSPERIHDPIVDAFAREKVEVSVDPTLATNAATVEIAMVSGRRLEERRAVPRGDAADPLTRKDVVDKFRTASRGQASEAVADRVIAAVTALESVGDASETIRLLRLGA
jgi:2-methylcitrate dehydratase PrpD